MGGRGVKKTWNCKENRARSKYIRHRFVLSVYEQKKLLRAKQVAFEEIDVSFKPGHSPGVDIFDGADLGAQYFHSGP